jgi:hypothetical protein
MVEWVRDHWLETAGAILGVAVMATLILTLVGVMQVYSVSGDTHQVVQHIRHGQKARAQELHDIRVDTVIIANIDGLIERALAEAKHPGQVDQSILYQLCRSTPGCRIP